MTEHVVHAPVGGKILTRPFKILLAIAGLGAVITLYRFAMGIGSVSNLNNGYPWGIWIAIDVVVGTAIGCGGFAMGLLVYIMNKGKYHPLVRPAVLTSLLGYGLAAVAVTIDLGRFWGLWKVPLFFWRWSHSPQLEVALCVMTYCAVLAVELSPALFEKWRDGKSPGLASAGKKGLGIVNAMLIPLLALGLLLPTMHQSSLGTMMLLPGPRMNALWFTPWLPFLFLVNCIIIGYAVVVLEATFSAVAFGRKRETAMIAEVGKVAAGIALFWSAFRVAEVAYRGELGALMGRRGLFFILEVGLVLAGALILLSKERRERSSWQVRAAMLLLVGGALHRINTYLIAFTPGPHYAYFPAVPELLMTFGIIATELLIYIYAVKTFPILGGAQAHATTRG
jgi:Ni/Fe-hydrogenase subunit HybB-like protein